MLTRSGYGEQGPILAFRALRSREELFDIFIQPLAMGSRLLGLVEVGQKNVNGLMKQLKKQLPIFNKGVNLTPLLQVTIPNEWEND